MQSLSAMLQYQLHKPLPIVTVLLVTGFSACVHAQDWQPYTGEENLRSLVSDTVLQGTLRGDVKATGR